MTFEAARSMKRTIRHDFAKGIFANVVHAAETQSEFLRQAQMLLGRCASCQIPLRPTEELGTPALRPGAINVREIFDIPRLVDEMLTQLATNRQAPCPVRLGELSEGAEEWGVYLGVDSDNSLDSAVVAVLNSVPGIAMEEALLTTLYAGRSHGHMIAIGAEPDARKCLGALTREGIKNCQVREV